MKKWVWQILFTLLVIMLVVGYQSFKKYNENLDEMLAFREYLDENYFPVQKDTSDYYDDIIENTANVTDINWNLSDYSRWYLIDGGWDRNTLLTDKLLEAEEKILNYELSTSDSSALKNNVLQTIALHLETLEDIQYDSTADYDPDGHPATIFNNNFKSNIDELSTKIQEMNNILSEYYH